MITLTIYKHRRRRRYLSAKARILKILLVIVLITSIFIVAYKLKFFTIVDGEKKFNVFTFANTYIDELSKMKININDLDKTSIEATSKIKNGSVFTINRNINMKLIYEGKEINVQTNSDNLIDVLKENNLSLKSTHVYNFDMKKRPENGMVLEINNIEYKQISKEEADKVSSGNGTVQNKHVIYEETYKNGVLISSKKLDEKLTNVTKQFKLVLPSENPDSLYVLVNKDNKLKDTFVPKDLVIPDVKFAVKCNGENQLNVRAATALEKMFKDASSQGIALLMLSGYRSFDIQKLVYTPGNTFVAEPGASEHQTGLTVDIINEALNSVEHDLNNDFLFSKEGEWLLNNCWKYGFILRYPQGKSHITGISFESWHFRYVGEDFAEVLHNLNYTLEEYKSMANS